MSIGRKRQASRSCPLTMGSSPSSQKHLSSEPSLPTPFCWGPSQDATPKTIPPHKFLLAPTASHTSLARRTCQRHLQNTNASPPSNQGLPAQTETLPGSCWGLCSCFTQQGFLLPQGCVLRTQASSPLKVHHCLKLFPEGIAVVSPDLSL